MINFDLNRMLFTLTPGEHDEETVRSRLMAHPEVKFVSFTGVDMGNHSTDEKIPVALFLNDMEKMLESGVQTDGSSVVLPGIATLNDGKVDLVPDSDVVWYIDYNYEHIDMKTGLPVGTLRIPSYLYHNGEAVCSRSVLKRSAEFFESRLKEHFENDKALCEEYGFEPEDLEKITLIMATELEFWVNSPDEKIATEQLSISQVLKESYWKRTKGVVRTALEQVILILDQYGFEKSVGKCHMSGSEVLETTYECDGKVYNEAEFKSRYKTMTVVNPPEQGSSSSGDVTCTPTDSSVAYFAQDYSADNAKFWKEEAAKHDAVAKIDSVKETLAETPMCLEHLRMELDQFVALYGAPTIIRNAVDSCSDGTIKPSEEYAKFLKMQEEWEANKSALEEELKKVYEDKMKEEWEANKSALEEELQKTYEDKLKEIEQRIDKCLNSSNNEIDK